MKTTRLLVFVVALTVLVPGCTDDGSGGEGGVSPSPATGPDVGPTPVETGSATSGRYEYENAELHVTIDIDGTAGTMEVDNGTSRELPQPDFYILEASSGDEIEGDVTAAAPVPAGAVATFDISFTGIRVADIGAIALLFGQDNYGLFVRTL